MLMTRFARASGAAALVALGAIAALTLPMVAQGPGIGPGAFTASGVAAVARAGQTLSLLPDGQVLVAGGADLVAGVYLASVERWDPATGAFTAAGDLARGRGGQTATLLADGHVLFVGGGTGDLAGNQLAAESELWDPTTDTSSVSGSLERRRTLHTATLLADGRVLIVGGFDGSGEAIVNRARAEIWDPGTGAFSAAGTLDQARYGHTASLLPDGRVLIVGGVAQTKSGFDVLATTEIWDPVSATFSAGPPLVEAHGIHTATKLTDGRILIVGGLRAPSELAGAEVWDPATDSFSTTGEPGTRRIYHSATQVPGGRVLIVGGSDGAQTMGTAELWDPVTGTFTPAAPMLSARDVHAAALLPDGRVLIVGSVPQAEVWTP